MPSEMRGRLRVDEMVGWPHHLHGHVFGQTPRDRVGRGSLAYLGVGCSPWGRKELGTT